MKLLILTCGTGEGHNRAALAMGELCSLNQIEFEIINPITLKNHNISHLIDQSYIGMIKKIPWLFQIIYRIGDLCDRSKLPSPVTGFNESCAPQLAEYIQRGTFDAVLSVHMFGMQIMTGVHKKKLSPIPSFGISTDYTCIPFMGTSKPDRCFIPHNLLKDEFRQHGLPEQCLLGTGIPVAPKFAHALNRVEARSTLHISQNAKVILIMTGGEGCGNMVTLCRKIPIEVDTYVLVGKNRRMQSELEAVYGKKSSIHVVPFTEQVEQYIAAADVLITKAGGLTSTEAAVIGIPIVHFLTYGACENGNVKFFTEHGLSIQAKNADDAVLKALALIHDPHRSAQMVQNQHKWINAHAGEDILAEIKRFCESNVNRLL